MKGLSEATSHYGKNLHTPDFCLRFSLLCIEASFPASEDAARGSAPADFPQTLQYKFSFFHNRSSINDNCGFLHDTITVHIAFPISSGHIGIRITKRNMHTWKFFILQ